MIDKSDYPSLQYSINSKRVHADESIVNSLCERQKTALSSINSSIGDLIWFPELTLDGKISPQLRKRKAAEAISSPNCSKKLAQGIASAARKESLPSPLTMDSDYEYMSGMSSDEDDVLLDESDDGSADGIF